jgi:DNA-directed RNA polymerase specialized sigma24 family protein
MKRAGGNDDDIVKALESADWQALYPRLRKYSDRKSRMYVLLGLPVRDAEDLVQEAVALALGAGPDGRRRHWNRESCPDLGQFLIGIIRSITSHEIEALKRHPQEDFSLHEEAIACGATHPSTAAVVSTVPSPDVLIEQEERAREINHALDEATSEDEEAQLVLLALRLGYTKAGAIAGETGLDVKLVYNALRRIRRRLEEFKDKVLKTP